MNLERTDKKERTKVYFGKNALDHLLEKDSRCDLIVADATIKTNPRKPTKEEIVAIYRDLWDFERTEIRKYKQHPEIL